MNFICIQDRIWEDSFAFICVLISNLTNKMTTVNDKVNDNRKSGRFSMGCHF